MASYNLMFWITVTLFPFVICRIKEPLDFVRNVGQNAVFKWNTTDGNTVLTVSWGLLGSDGKSVTPQFMYISNRTGPVFDANLDTVAVRYKGRVSWVGDLNAGHAWFKITNLTIQDTNQYAAAIREQGKNEAISYSTNLTVALQTTVNPTTTATTTTATTTTESTTTDVRGLSKGEIAGISGGLGALLLAVCSVFGICYCCKKGMCEVCGCEIYWCECCCCECCCSECCICVPSLCPKRKDEEGNKTEDNQSGGVMLKRK